MQVEMNKSFKSYHKSYEGTQTQTTAHVLQKKKKAQDNYITAPANPSEGCPSKAMGASYSSVPESASPLQ